MMTPVILPDDSVKKPRIAEENYHVLFFSLRTGLSAAFFCELLNIYYLYFALFLMSSLPKEDARR